MRLFVLGKQVTSPFPSFSGFGGGRGGDKAGEAAARGSVGHGGAWSGSFTSGDLLKDYMVGGSRVHWGP